MRTIRHPLTALAATFLAALPAVAQVPDTLLHSIPPPPGGAEPAGELGTSIAMDGDYTVVGAPSQSGFGPSLGRVRVFHSGTGELLFVLHSPADHYDGFGRAVAISGSHVAVGAYAADSGAENSGSVFVFDLTSPTPTEPVATLSNPAPAPSDNFGWSVGISGTLVAVGAYLDDNYAGSAFVFDLASATPEVPVATLTDPEPARPWNFYFGYSVGISGTRVAVGSVFDNTGAVQAGGAYVFDIASATPTLLLTRLNNPSPETSDNFGASVAISGDRVVVGAPAKQGLSDDHGAASRAGMACIYDLGSITPADPVLALHNPRPRDYEMFGTSVAISGTRVAVGVPGDDVGDTETERAYVYDLAHDIPDVPVTTLHNPAPRVDDFFGTSVAISETRVAVGAPGATSAYIYDTTSATPAVPAVTLHNFNPVAGNSFGISVAVSGSLMVVGAPGDDTGAENAGSAYVYDLASATPTLPVSTLHNPGPAAQDMFGVAVAISGNRVVVGAHNDNEGGDNYGRAYIYDLAGATPTAPVATLSDPGSLPGGFFGVSVAISGMRVVVGTWYAQRAYAYDLDSPAPTVPVVTLNNPTPGLNENFGKSVAISGTRVVVADQADGTGGYNSGSAWVYDLAGAAPAVPVVTLNNPTPAWYDRFGSSVAIAGTRVVVGAILDDSEAEDAGSVYVYDLAGATPAVPECTLHNPEVSAIFGTSVAISGNLVVVGNHAGEREAGSAYVYDFSRKRSAVPGATLHNPHPAVEDYFGHSVAIDGTTVAVGTYADSSLGFHGGAAYVFGPHPLDQDSDGLLDSWEVAHFGNTARHGAHDDADHDGYNELLEEAFGTDPLVPDGSAVPAFINEGGYLTITITKRPGVLYSVQSAGDLADSSFSAVTTTVLLDSNTTLKVRDNMLTGTLPRRYLRVNVTAAPQRSPCR